MYISDLDLIKAKLTIEGKQNQSEIIKLILHDWSVDEKQKFMEVGERYYAGRHDILNHDFRRSIVYDKVPAEDSDDGKEHEIAETVINSNRSNMHNIHPFFQELVNQKIGKVFTLSEAQTGVNLPPMHPNDRCTIAPKIPGAENKGSLTAHDPETDRNYKVPANLSYEDWRKEICEKYGADSLEKAQKKYQNRKTDAVQLKNLKKVLGKDAPNDLAELQSWKYNEPEKWEKVKSQTKYITENPQSNLTYYRVNEKLNEMREAKQIRAKGVAVSPNIPLEIKTANDHTLMRFKERNLSMKDAQDFYKNALVALKQRQGQQYQFYSDRGFVAVNTVGEIQSIGLLDTAGQELVEEVIKIVGQKD